MKTQRTILLNSAFLSTLIFYLVFSAYPVYSEVFETMAPNAEAFPEIKMPFVVKDNMGNPQKYISESDFTVTENGQQIPSNLTRVVCSETGAPIQLMFMFDQSTSMGEEVNGRRKIEWVRRAIKKFIENVDLSYFSTISIRAFCTDIEVYSDFTKDMDMLSTAVESIGAKLAATDFNTAFLEPETGIIDGFKNVDGMNKVAVFLSDGKHSPSYGNLEEQLISGGLASGNITLFSYIISSEQDHSITAIKNISNNSGGFCQKGLAAYSLPDAFEDLAASITRIYNCELIWQSELYCLNEPRKTNVRVRYKPGNKSKNYVYYPPDNSIFKVAGADGEGYFFDNPAPGNTVEKEITITPTPWDMQISDISLQSEEYFEIVDFGDGSGSFPQGGINVSAGESLTLRVAFTQKENMLPRQSAIEIEAYPCDRKILLYGGEADIEAEMVAESEYVCDEVTISWSMIPDYCKKDIYFSRNGGAYQLIAKDVTGSSYIWQPPKTEGNYRVLVRGFPVDGIDDYVSDETNSIYLHFTELEELTADLLFNSTPTGDTFEKNFEDVFINRGQVPVNIINATITGADRNYFDIVDSPIGEYLPDEQGDIKLSFSPDEVREFSARLNLINECGEDFSIKITGLGTCNVLTPDILDFGDVVSGRSKDSLFIGILENPLSTNLRYTIDIQGADAADFTLVGMSIGKSYNLAPKESVSIEIVFSPISAGQKNARLIFNVFDCQTAEVALTGRGIYREISISPVHFGRKRLKSTFPTEYFVLRNQDNLDKTISSAFTKGNNHFEIELDAPITIPGYDSAYIPIRFEPEPGYTAGYTTDAFFITDYGDTLISTADGSTFLPVLSSESSCPDRESGEEYAIITIENSEKNDSLYIYEISISEGNDEFSWYSGVPDSGFSLPPLSSKDYLLKYSPIETGSHSAKISVFADNHDAEFQGEGKENIIELNCSALFFDFIPPEFPPTMICDTSVSVIREIRNKSDKYDLKLFLSRAHISGKDSADFILRENTDITIPPGDTSEIELTFMPRRKGLHEAEVSIPANSQQDLLFPISGEGVFITPEIRPAEKKYLPGDTLIFQCYFEIPDHQNPALEYIEFTLKYDREMVFPLEESLRFAITDDLTAPVFFTPDSAEFSRDGRLHIAGKCLLAGGETHHLLTLKYLGLMTKEKSSEISTVLHYPCSDDLFTLSTIVRDSLCADDLSLIVTNPNINRLEAPIPNPASEIISVTLGISESGSVKLQIYDMSGKPISLLMNDRLEAGTHKFDFDVSQLPSGTYFLLMSTGKHSFEQKLGIEK